MKNGYFVVVYVKIAKQSGCTVKKRERERGGNVPSTLLLMNQVVIINVYCVTIANNNLLSMNGI